MTACSDLRWGQPRDLPKRKRVGTGDAPLLGVQPAVLRRWMSAAVAKAASLDISIEAEKGQRLPTMSASVLNESRVSIRGETGMTSERRVENSS